MELDREAVASQVEILKVIGDEPDLLLRYRQAFPGHYQHLDTWYLIPAVGESRWDELMHQAIDRGRPIDQSDLDIPIENPATKELGVLS